MIRKSFEAYALKGAGYRSLALASNTPINLTGEGGEGRTTWIHVAPFGAWDHPDGHFDLTPESFAALIDEANARVTPIRLDYDHASLEPSGQGTPASGWVKGNRLEVRSDGLYALVEFTERAAAMIRAGEYKFNSPTLDFNRKDRVDASKVWPVMLDSIALTNNPYLDGQAPLTLSATQRRGTRALSTGAPKTMKISMKELTDALKKTGAEDFSPEKLKKLIDAIQAMKDASLDDEEVAETASEVVEEEAAEEVAASAVALSEAVALAEQPELGAEVEAVEAPDFMAKLMEASGMDEASLLAALESSVEAIATLLKGGDPAAPEAAALTVRALSENLSGVRARLAKYEAAERKDTEDKLTAEVDELVKAGKILPAKRGEIRSFAVKSPKAFREMASALAPAWPVDRHATALSAPAPGSAMAAVIDESNPRVVATNKALDRMGVTDPKARQDALNKVTKA